MTSIRKQVFRYLDIYQDKTVKETQKYFGDCPKETIRTYYRQYNKNTKSIPLDIRTELIKIIKDYKQPASARVQAIREYNNLVEKEPDKSGEDPYLKFLEKKSLRIATTIDTSSNQ